jgi:hypothetical protein
MSTPGTARAQTILYRKTVCFGLANQQINFATAASLGHRVQVSIPVDLMNQYFYWTRDEGVVSPVGRFTNAPSGVPTFNASLVAAFNGDYTDLDGVAKGLNFSSSALDMDNNLKRDVRGNSANDLVMAYLMFKCFGSSAYDPTDIIYNLEDAFNMLTSEQLADAIKDSLLVEDGKAALVTPTSAAGLNKGEVDAMFRGFLAADPMRYFKNGTQIEGLFETTVNQDYEGNWCFTIGDKIEVPLQLVFTEAVNVLSVQDNIANPSSSTPDEVYTNIIEGEANYAVGSGTPAGTAAATAAKKNVIPIRLQIVCAAPSVAGGSTGSSAVASTDRPLLQVAAKANAIFYTHANYDEQTAIVAMAAGGSGAYNYTYAPAVAGATMNLLTGVLTFAPSGQAASRTAVVVTIKDAADLTAAGVTANVNITLDAGDVTSTTFTLTTGNYPIMNSPVTAGTTYTFVNNYTSTAFVTFKDINNETLGSVSSISVGLNGTLAAPTGAVSVIFA